MPPTSSDGAFAWSTRSADERLKITFLNEKRIDRSQKASPQQIKQAHYRKDKSADVNHKQAEISQATMCTRKDDQ